MENTNLTPEQVIEKLDGMFTEKMTNIPTNEDVESYANEEEKEDVTQSSNVATTNDQNEMNLSDRSDPESGRNSKRRLNAK